MRRNVPQHEPYTKFKMYLDSKGIPQKEVAELIGKTAPVFCQNLNGVSGDFMGREIAKICKNYKISADEFFLN